MCSVKKNEKKNLDNTEQRIIRRIENDEDVEISKFEWAGYFAALSFVIFIVGSFIRF